MNFETQNLRFRPFNLADTKFILELVNTEDWLKYIGDRNVHSEKDAENYLVNGPLKSYTENGFGLSMVELKDSRTPVGMCGLIKRAGLDDIDIGFALLPKFYKKGYAVEIAEATLNYGFEKLNLPKIVAITMESNSSSIALLKKIGMRFEKNVNLPNDPETLLLFSALNNSKLNLPPFSVFPTLKDERIILRDLEKQEAPNIIEVFHYNQKPAKTTEDVLEILKKADIDYQNGTMMNWGIALKDTNEMIGVIGYYRGFKNQTGEIGFVLKAAHHRNGYTKEALDLVVKFGYEKMNLTYIKAFTKDENVAAKKLFAKCGFEFVRVGDDEYLEFLHRC